MKKLIHLLPLLLLSLSTAINATPIPAEAKTNGVAIGVQAYTFREYSAFEAVERAAQVGAKVIEFYDGQRYSPTDSSRFGHNSSNEKITAMKSHLKKHNIRAVNYGVVPIPKDEKQARKIFEFARKMELYAITTESVDAIDTIEKLVKEYDIRVGYHNHPRQPRNSNYKVWDAKFILNLVKDRDPRIGAAADIGHWTTDKFNAVENLKLLEGRIISVHAKDRKNIGHPVENLPLGKGIIGIGGVLDELRRQNFQGNISIEHEANWRNNLNEVAQGIAFVREYTAGKK